MKIFGSIEALIRWCDSIGETFHPLTETKASDVTDTSGVLDEYALQLGYLRHLKAQGLI